MKRQRRRDVLFAAVIVALMLLVSAALWRKSSECSTMGGSLEIRGARFIQPTCRLRSGEVIAMW